MTLHLLDISVGSLNLFSGVLGMMFAYLAGYSYSGRRTTIFLVLLYFISLSVHFYIKTQPFG